MAAQGPTCCSACSNARGGTRRRERVRAGRVQEVAGVGRQRGAQGVRRLARLAGVEEEEPVTTLRELQRKGPETSPALFISAGSRPGAAARESSHRGRSSARGTAMPDRCDISPQKRRTIPLQATSNRQRFFATGLTRAHL